MLYKLISPICGEKLIHVIYVFIFGAILISCPLNIYAQSITQGDITLSVAIKRTLQQNPDLHVFKFRDSGLQGEAQTADLNPGYSIGADIDSWGGSNAENNPANPNFGILLSSVIELGGKRDARVKTVQASQSRLTIQRKIVALDLMGEVARRFVDVLSTQESIKIAIQAEKIAKETLQAVKKRSLAGITPIVEIKRAEAMLIQAQLTVSLERQQLLYYKSALSILWGEQVPRFSDVKGDLYNFGDDISFKEMYIQAKNNPNIKLYAAEDRLRDAELHLTQTQSSIDIDWSVGLRQYTALKYPVVVAGITVPLFSAQRNRGSIVSSQAALDEVDVTLKSALLNLHTQLYHAYQNRKQAVLTAQTLRNNIIPLLKESSIKTRSYYEQGLYSYLELTAANKELINAREDLVTTATAVLRYNADIEQLTAEALFNIKDNI